MVDAVMCADVFVLVSDHEGTDMFVELGIALARTEGRAPPRLYSAGPHARRSLMQLHPAILHAADLREVSGREGVSCEGFNDIKSARLVNNESGSGHIRAASIPHFFCT